MDSPLCEAPIPPAGISEDLYCDHCGYNLRALTVERCPECGEAFDAAELLASRIPWARRRRLGRFRTYWQTVGMVVLRHTRFCEQTGHPVDYAAAQRFRWVTMLHVYVPLLAMTVAAYVFYPPRPLPTIGLRWLRAKASGTTELSVFDWVYMEPWLMVVAHGCMLLWLLAVTGVHSYFFHPRHVDAVTRDRANALSYYACAPLALMPAPLALVAYGLQVSQGYGDLVLFQTGCLSVVLVMGLFWAFSVLMLSRLFPADVARRWGMMVTLPMSWLVLGAVILVGVGASVVVVAVVIASVV